MYVRIISATNEDTKSTQNLEIQLSSERLLALFAFFFFFFLLFSFEVTRKISNILKKGGWYFYPTRF